MSTPIMKFFSARSMIALNKGLYIQLTSNRCLGSLSSRALKRSQLKAGVCMLTSHGQQLNRSVVNSLSTNYYHCRLFQTSRTLYDEIRTIVVPQLAESISEGDIRWDKAVGDSVDADEDVGFVETDKTTVPIKSPVSGVIEELLVEDGSTVKPGQEIFRVKAGAEGAKPAAPKPEPAKESKPEEGAPPPPPPRSSQEEMPRSPPPPPPSPPKEPISKTSPQPPKQPTGPAPPGPQLGARTETRVKMNRMRLRIAQRLKDAQNTYAMLTTMNEIDMSNIMEMRKKYQDAFVKRHGVKLGFMSAFVKAASCALQDQPVVNAVIDENEIIYRDYIDISVAVSSPKGLVVPVLRNVETMNFAGIERTINELGEKARNNALAIEDMDGGTFTISNGGIFGSLLGTPIINPPQSAILGMHGIFERPVAVNGQVVIRPMMYVALTYDHRLIDGREAVTFLRKVKAGVEDPRTMLLDI